MRKRRLGGPGQPQHQLSIVKNRRAIWCRGQSIIEYLLIVAAVIGAIVLLANPTTGLLKGAVDGIGDDAETAMGKAELKLKEMSPEALP